ncbi:hypothetical protein [Yoonia sp.]|uniref:hypothetical protein n=1 Tax=Yoonia sp. TaxID=2212373 RepID=UPI002FDA3B95
MEIAANLNAVLPPPQSQAPAVERAVTSKVAVLEQADRPATLPSDRPFIAQAVAARLEGSDYPDPPSEIAPPERTLRPYDIPMLPYEPSGENDAIDAMDADRHDSTDDDR